jgi:hypothetical protein
VEAETVKTIEAKLRGICGHETCLGREAMLEAVRWVIDEPSGWILEKEDDQLRLYAILGHTVHSLSADCVPPADPRLEARETANCEYVVLEPLTGGEYVRSTMEVTAGGPGGDLPSAFADWAFELHQPISLRYKIGADAPTHDFAVALLAAIVAARGSAQHR